MYYISRHVLYCLEVWVNTLVIYMINNITQKVTRIINKDIFIIRNVIIILFINLLIHKSIQQYSACAHILNGSVTAYSNGSTTHVHITLVMVMAVNQTLQSSNYRYAFNYVL